MHSRDAAGVRDVRVEDDGSLTIQAPMSPRIRLYAESEASFFAKREEWRVTFPLDEAGDVVGLVLDWNGREQRYARVGGRIPPSPVVAGNAVSPVSAEDVARYAGTYLLEIGGRTHELRIFGKANGLMAEPQGQGVTPLVPEGEHAFVFVVNPGIRLVFSLKNGRAESVTLHQGGGTWSGARMR